MPLLPLFKKLKPNPKPRKWISRREELPWFDRPDALDRLESNHLQGKHDDRENGLLQQWVTDGYCVAQGCVDESDIDGMMRDLGEIWTASAPIRHLSVLGARLKEEDPLSRTHDEIVAMPRAQKEELRDKTPWRVHNFFAFSPHAKRIHENADLKRLASLIFGCEAIPRATINFMYGSRQSLHQDMTVFHIFPMNYLIGVWLACEDIHPDSGPLVFYPGSHKTAMFERFDNYPQTSLKTCDPATRTAYEEHLETTSRRFDRHTFLAKKGDVLFWHGMLIHGGDTVNNHLLTRKSYVCHYIPEGMDRDKEIVGPFNW